MNGAKCLEEIKEKIKNHIDSHGSKDADAIYDWAIEEAMAEYDLDEFDDWDELVYEAVKGLDIPLKEIISHVIHNGHLKCVVEDNLVREAIRSL